MTEPVISVLVRTHNDRDFIASTLKALLEQKIDLPYEVVVCDDNSTDGTSDILKDFPQVRQVTRPEGKYVPGRTLNNLIRHTAAPIIVFNNADATPQNDQFLASLTAPLLDDSADITFANQTTRPDAQLLVQKDHLRAFGDGSISAKWHFFFSLASSAAKGSLLREFPFDENIGYSEDVEWAYRLQRRIRYVPDAIVQHSHNYTNAELKKRFYGEGKADAQIFGCTPTLPRQAAAALLETLRDWRYLLKTPGGMKEFFQAPLRRWIQKYYYLRGVRDYVPQFKVAHVVRRFTFDEWGGTETVVWNTALNLREIGIESEILCTSALSQPGIEIKDGIKIRRFPYRYPYFPMDKKAELALDKKGGNPLSADLLKTLRQGRFSLIHIHCGGRLAKQSILIAKKLHIPCVLTLHGGGVKVPEEEIRQMMLPVKGKFNYGGILDRLNGCRRCEPLAESDAVLALNQDETAEIKKRFPEQMVICHPNGINIPRDFQLPDIREKWNIPADRRIILCISRIDYQKDQKILVSLLKKLTDQGGNYHLLLIGPVTAQWYRDEIMEQVRKDGLEDRFTLIPGLPPGDSCLLAALKEAWCFILPSLHEPFGIVALEAWAAGTPLIASDSGGLKDFVINDRNGLTFPAGNLDALLEACKKLAETPETRKRLSAQAAEDVKQYLWINLTRKLAELYKKLRNQ